MYSKLFFNILDSRAIVFRKPPVFVYITRRCGAIWMGPGPRFLARWRDRVPVRWGGRRIGFWKNIRTKCPKMSEIHKNVFKLVRISPESHIFYIYSMVYPLYGIYFILYPIYMISFLYICIYFWGPGRKLII